MIAPAVMAGETPTNDAMPINPTPMVPAVDQELPVPRDMAAQISAVAR